MDSGDKDQKKHPSNALSLIKQKNKKNHKIKIRRYNQRRQNQRRQNQRRQKQRQPSTIYKHQINLTGSNVNANTIQNTTFNASNYFAPGLQNLILQNVVVHQPPPPPLLLPPAQGVNGCQCLNAPTRGFIHLGRKEPAPEDDASFHNGPCCFPKGDKRMYTCERCIHRYF